MWKKTTNNVLRLININSVASSVLLWYNPISQCDINKYLLRIASEVCCN